MTESGVRTILPHTYRLMALGKDLLGSLVAEDPVRDSGGPSMQVTLPKAYISGSRGFEQNYS